MRSSTFSDAQIITILKQNEDGISVSDLCREHDMANAIFYKWRAKFGDMDVSLIKRMNELEAENKRLKKCTLKSVSKPRCARKPLRESTKAVSTQRDGQEYCC